jgi:hypothetical protein
MLRLTLLPLIATLTPALAGWLDSGDPADSDAPPRCFGPGVRINELLPDPIGADNLAMGEWVELYNGGPTADLGGWTLQRTSQSGRWDSVFTFPAGTRLTRGGVTVVREAYAPPSAFEFEAVLELYGGTGGDGVRLTDCEGNIVDAVVYGADNSDGIEDESGLSAVSWAMKPGSGESLARLNNGVDTNIAANDFGVSELPTPGALNPVYICETGALRISELLPNPSGVDAVANNEWIELYNPGPSPLTLDHWRVETATQPGSWSLEFELPNGTVIASGGFLVVAGPNAPYADIVVDRLDFPSGSHGDGLRLVDCAGDVTDLLIWGEDNDDQIADANGDIPEYVAPKPGDDEVLVRDSENFDSDDSFVDFIIREGTPGSSNEAALYADTGATVHDSDWWGPGYDSAGGSLDTGVTNLETGDSAVAVACSTGDASGVTINEILPDPDGSDGTALAEWAELYATADADLSGWRLERASRAGAWDEMVTFPEGTSISADGTLLVRESNAAAAANELVAALQMYSGSGGDGVRLVDCEGTVVDALVYGDSNTDAIEDESGQAAATWAPKPGSAESVARASNGADTDDAAADFVVSELPTPGAANPELVCEIGRAHISELLVNPAGADSAAASEYIELFNPGTEPLALDGWRVESATQGNGSWSLEAEIPAGTVIDGGGFLVIGGANATGADITLTIDFPSGSNGDGVRIVDCAGGVTDLVLYGEDNDDGLSDEQGQIPTSIAPKPGDDEVLIRDDERLDSDDAAVDFRLGTGTPGLTNRTGGDAGTDVALDTAGRDSGQFDTGGFSGDSGNGGGGGGGGACSPASIGVKINELLSDPAGADGTALAEWVELYAPDDADLSGWTLERASRADGWDEMLAFPDGTEVNADDFLLIREENGPSSSNELVSELQLYSGTNGDGIRLLDCEGNVADTVIYGDSNDDAFVDDGGDIATSVAPKPGSDEAIARKSDGVDTDASGDDFKAAAVPTPGAPNPVDVCNPGADIVINEFVANPAGADAAAANEWIELYNNGTEAILLDGWTIESSSRADSVSLEVSLPTGVEIGPGEFLVIGAPNAPVRDVPVDALDLPSGSNGDGLRLLDCEGALIDVVVYGEDNDDAVVGEDGDAWATVAPKPGDDEAVGRLTDGADTNASEDWALAGSPTPGGPNDFTPPEDTDLPDEPKVCSLGTASGLVINEFMADPAGSDSAVLTEWVELYNAGNDTLDLSGWQLQRASKPDDWDEQIIIPDGTSLASGQFLMITEQNGPVNADAVVGLIQLYSGTDTDGVRITDCNGVPADTVLYGPPGNTDMLVDDSGAVATSVAADPGSDQALARRIDGQDTNASGDDFVLTSSPSPGATNPRLTCNLDDAIVINEFLADPTGADSDVKAEWVELFNPRNEDLDVTGWSLKSRSQGDSSPSTEFDLPRGAIIPAQGYLVVGGANVAFADYNADPFDLPSGSGGDGLYLVDCKGDDVDVALYGGENVDLLVEQTGDTPATLGPDPGSDQVVARASNGLDTDVCAADFVIAQRATPGAENPTVAPPVCEDGAIIVINEALVNPTGSDSDALAEWVELYNPGDLPVRLDGWTISTITSYDSEDAANNETEKVALPTGTVIDPGGYYVIGDLNVPEADFVLDRAFSLGSGSGGDGIALRDCAGDLADQLLYGDTNDDGLIGEDGVEPDNLPPSPNEAECLARRQDGLDTNADSRDFQATGECTPGAENPESEEIDCQPAESVSVVLNEILPDPSGTDAGFEWIELYNPTDSRVSLDGWYLQIDSFDAIDLILPGGIDIEPGGYFIIAGSEVQHPSDPEWSPDVEAALSIGNSAEGAGVRLLDCDGDRVDTVIWGTSNENGLRDDLSVAPEPPSKRPGSDQTIHRAADGVDTNNVDDWKVGSPTLGASNVVEIDGNDDTEVGCGRGDPSDRELGGRCDGTGGSSRSALTLTAALVALLRRKRR